jgi:hypothetical protein
LDLEKLWAFKRGKENKTTRVYIQAVPYFLKQIPGTESLERRLGAEGGTTKSKNVPLWKSS